MATGSNVILHDFYPMLRAYKDGKIERLIGKDIVPASVDSDTGVQSKDVDINQNLTVRLYLPKDASPGEKVPLLVYFHGGGFLVQSALSATYQKHLNLLVAEAKVVAVSVDYRKAPEHPVPIAYEDSWLALNWVASHGKGEGSEPWLKDYADFGRVYLGGDSAGGNIAHNMAVRAGVEQLDGIDDIVGVFLNCPFFAGKEPVGNEAANLNAKSFVDKLWVYVCPTSSGVDDPAINPATDPKLKSLGCKKVLVYVAEKDMLTRDRGWYYKEVLSKSGWVGDIEVVEVEGEYHVFNLLSPHNEKTVSVVKKLAYFLNHGKP